ncbi:MAG: Extracellular Matrix protein PelA [uncultured Sulfurovum sp.]|uniref:Extracellular Matrix protein PelA n=1 Tax=uncultured Sulfurovum sp. TaxID=269237 RepID=A0A6S6T905_9BACT|nr:MAG: Extracellular Matrix protein PelA [uncultured Sulfurovum sp.]
MLFSELFAQTPSNERYAFIYSKSIDDRFINFYDKVVVEADAIDNIYALRYPEKMVAYVSVGEIEPWRKTKTTYQKSWVISKNKTWNSLIADLNNDAYQAFIFERIAKLYKMGYRHFFLDTMDAYHVTAEDKKVFQSQQTALISFIKKLHQKYPRSKIIVNRGFELLDHIHQDIHAVVAESLIGRYQHETKSYTKVPKNDHQWLLNNFRKAQAHGLTAISIEYTNKSSKTRLEMAKKVKALGITPYVTDGLLQEQGECEVERIRRDVLILINQSNFKEKNPIYSNAHLSLSLPIEHYGYVPILYDISTKELPKRIEDKYHSIIVWVGGETKNNAKLYEWAIKAKEKKIKVLFLDSFAYLGGNEQLKAFGINKEENKNQLVNPIHVHYDPSYEPYEIPYKGNYFAELFNVKEAKKVIHLNYQNQQTSTPIAITSWGGYALYSSFLISIDNVSHWTINPFQFIKEALNFDEIPMPDPTTEAGRRILFTHIDGDGFVEFVRMQKDTLSMEYLIENIYKKYQIPHTISLIQGEMQHLFPKLTSRMENVARELYQIPWIEPASHTLSHPFFWAKLVHPKQHTSTKLGKHYHLPIKNYRFSLKRETVESVNYVLSLAPKSKQKERILFWSGDCQPPKKVLEYVEKNGIITLNGGDTTVQKKNPTINYIAPFGLQHDEYWQIYTGQQNENVYTNNWLGPFWGYRNVIETFEMTNKPYRIKPINIYYHLYIASKQASFNSLKEVYTWAVKQKTSKLYASQYIKKGQDFYRTALGKTDHGFEIKNQGFLRTLRFDKKINVDIAHSKGVAGHNFDNNASYITLDSSGKYELILNKNKRSPQLIDSNGWVDSISTKQQRYAFKLKANVPLEANFYLPKNCRYLPNKKFKLKKSQQTLALSSLTAQGGTIVFLCQ